LVEVVTLLDGEILTVESTGAVFCTMMSAVPVSLPPSASVAVAVQTIASSGKAVVLVSVRVLLLPRVVPSVLLVQS
jgi:hypothetical protein